MARHLLDLCDLGPSGVLEVLALCAPDRDNALANSSVAMVFEKPSARTRNATEMAVVDLGGHPVVINDSEVGIDTRETAEDVARTLACYHQTIAARVRDHNVLVRMRETLEAQGGSVSVINLLSDHSHPCQGLADALTILGEFGDPKGRKVTYVGDSNNVALSLTQAALALGMEVAIASPEGYQPNDDFISAIEPFVASGAGVSVSDNPRAAAEGASVLYTDVWTSMGQEAERAQRLRDLAGYSVDEDLLGCANADAVVLHCLPAHRGEEISGSVLENPQSRIWVQAAHRRTAMRGVLRWARGI
jgi:ornithine carbamoyltransferase